MENKPADYRLGNLVEYDNRVFEIYTIAKEFPTLNTTEFGIGVVGWSNIKPILLTEEWLLKFGFEKIKHVHDGVVYKKSWLRIKDGFNSGDWRGAPLNVVPKYVHSLMNLYYCLTGEELTIKTEEK